MMIGMTHTLFNGIRFAAQQFFIINIARFQLMHSK